MKNLLFRRRIAHNNHLFNNQYLDPKALYAFHFGMLPCVSYLTEADVNPVLRALAARFDGDLITTYRHSGFNRDTGRMEFNVCLLVLKYDRMIEVGGDYITVFHHDRDTVWAATLLKDLAVHRVPDRSAIGFATRQAAAN